MYSVVLLIVGAVCFAAFGGRGFVRGHFAERDAERLLIENLNDAKSYERVKVESNPIDGGVYVKIRYRAKNGFGALTLGQENFIVWNTGSIEPEEVYNQRVKRELEAVR